MYNVYMSTPSLLYTTLCMAQGGCFISLLWLETASFMSFSLRVMPLPLLATAANTRDIANRSSKLQCEKKLKKNTKKYKREFQIQIKLKTKKEIL